MKAAMEFRLTKRVEGNRYSKKKKKKVRRNETPRTAQPTFNLTTALHWTQFAWKKRRRKSSRTVSKERAEKG